MHSSLRSRVKHPLLRAEPRLRKLAFNNLSTEPSTSDSDKFSGPASMGGVNCEVRTTLNHYPAAVDVDTYASDKPGSITCQKSHNFGYVGAGAVPA